MMYDVIGIENPLIDLMAQVPEQFLRQWKLEKNRMMLIDQARHGELLQALDGVPIHAEPGGSCANTILGVAQLGGRTAYCGKVGGDEYGRVYMDKLKQAGVASFVRAGDKLTGSTVILVTPDAQRTMNTFLGACQELSASDIPLDALKQSRRLYITGYLWDTDGQKEAALLALRTAKAEGISVAMSLSDPFCVNRHRGDFENILKTYADLVFANREEALAQTGTDSTHEALRVLRGWCQRVVITLGGSGAIIAHGDQTCFVDPNSVPAVDTTGAGDAFAAGFLYGLATDAGLYQCGRLGNYFASRVIQQMGPRLSGDVRALLAPMLSDPRK
jgi:sugar/nucleoside kinase (ribokinase family)